MNGAPRPTPHDAAPPTLRVAIYHDLPSGGAKRALHAQLAGLRARGHTIHAFVPTTADDAFLPTRDVVSKLTSWPRERPPERDALLAGRGILTGLRRWAAFFRTLHASERALARHISTGGFDVAFVQPSQFTQAPLLLRGLTIPSLYYCQEALRAAHEPRVATPGMRVLIRETLGRIDRATVGRATAVGVNSAYSAEVIRRVYGRVPDVIPLGVDIEHFRPLPVRRERSVLSVGALHPLKGHDTVIDAVARIPAASRPLVRIVGDRSRAGEADRLLRRATEAGVTLDLRLRVDEAELVRLYNRAGVVVLAPHREPFGLAALEAMACATPVIAVDEGGLRETVGRLEAGFLEPRDPPRIAARILRLLDDADLTTALGRRAREHVVTQWSWARAIDALEARLVQLSATGGPAPSTRGSRAGSS